MPIMRVIDNLFIVAIWSIYSSTCLTYYVICFINTTRVVTVIIAITFMILTFIVNTSIDIVWCYGDAFPTHITNGYSC